MPPCARGTFPYTIRPGDTLWLIAQRFNTTIDRIASVNPGIDLNNLYIGQVICIRPEYGFHTPTGINSGVCGLSNHLRLLWEQHVVWTRLVIISIIFNLPDVEFVTKRLLRNPKDFATALRPLYGEQVAARFDSLLTSHLVIAAELVKAAKAGDSRAAANAERRWYANADEIAAFLARINPYWSEQEWKDMLYEHLAFTKAEAVNILTGKYAEGIAVFDQIEMQALEMADVMTNGIIRQFPANIL